MSQPDDRVAPSVMGAGAITRPRPKLLGTMAAALYLLAAFGPFVLLPALPLVPATVLTLRRVHDPLLLLMVAIFTGLVGALCLAETAFRGYWIEVQSAELKVECAELGLIAVVVGIVAMRRLAKRVSLAAGLLIAIISVVAFVLVASGLDRAIAANVMSDSLWWIGTYPGVQEAYANHVRVDVVTVLTPAVAIALFWPTWYLVSGRLPATRPFHNALAVGLVGLAPIGVLTWTLLPSLASNNPLPPMLLHEALVLLTWWLAIAAGCRSASSPVPTFTQAITRRIRRGAA